MRGDYTEEALLPTTRTHHAHQCEWRTTDSGACSCARGLSGPLPVKLSAIAGHDLQCVIDLNERGFFYAHVEDEDGSTLLELSNEDPDTGLPLDQVSLIEDGFMRHAHDTHGLLNYLEHLGIVGDGNSLHLSH